MASKTHILVIPYPLQGHINPIVQFCKRLVSTGQVQITLVFTDTRSKDLNAHETSPFDVEVIPDALNRVPATVEDFIDNFRTAVSGNLPELVEKQSRLGKPVRALMFDALIPYAMDIARQKLHLPGFPFCTQSCAVTSIYYHMHRGTLEIRPKGPSVSLPSMPTLELNDLPNEFGPYKVLKDEVLDQFSTLQKGDLVLFNTFDKLEEEVKEWLTSQWEVLTIGPTVPSMYIDKRLADDKAYGLNLFKPTSEGCMKWLDQKETGSVVYASFGSLASLDEKQMKELAWGLMASNCYFLWVVRDTAQDKFPSNFMSEASEKGLLVDWCPQLEVLSHKAVGCFLTHCGWNSTLEALSLGVPMVAMPHWVDQKTNAKFVADVWHAGVRVKTEDSGIVTKEEIAKCIKEVMQQGAGDEVRRNISRWKDLAKEAIDEGGSSDQNIKSFISRLQAPNPNATLKEKLDP